MFTGVFGIPCGQTSKTWTSLNVCKPFVLVAVLLGPTASEDYVNSLAIVYATAFRASGK